MDNPRERTPSPRPRSRTPSPQRTRSRSRSPRRSASRSPSPRRRSPSPARRSPDRRRGGPRERHPPAEPSKVLGVFGLSGSTTEADLRKEFDRFGDLDHVDLIMDKKTNRSRGFGFVYFHTLEAAMKAKEGMSGMNLHGRDLRIDYSVTKRAHTPTPGEYKGRRTDRYDDRRDYRDRGYDRYDRDRGYSRRYSPRRSPRRESRYEPYDRHYRSDRDRYDDRYYDSRSSRDYY